MIRKYHNHTLQTNSRHREEEPQIVHVVQEHLLHKHVTHFFQLKFTVNSFHAYGDYCGRSVLIWIPTVCKGYQQMTKVAASKERVNNGADQTAWG